MAEKYTFGGCISGLWLKEQEKKDRERQKNKTEKRSHNYSRDLIQYQREQNELEFKNKLQIAFDFYKSKTNPQDKEICKIVMCAVKL